MSEDPYQVAAYIRGFLQGLLGPPEGPPPGAGRAKPRPTQFPPAGIDLITHEVRVRMDAEKLGFSEIISLDGAMVIQRTDPYINKEKCRQIDFKVLSWVATGWMEKFDSALVYTLSEDVEQPLSSIVAHQTETDFPAAFNFVVIFDARINNRTVFRQLEGRPEGHGFGVVPPTGDRSTSPTITRFMDVGNVKFDHPDIGPILISPIDCNDQSGKTLRTIPGMPLVKMPDFGGRRGGATGSRRKRGKK